jgi:hypothetical protein
LKHRPHSELPPPPPPPEPATGVELQTGLKPSEFFPDVKLWQGSTVHPNTAQNWFFVTEDKVRLYLHDYAHAVNTRSAWIAPLTLTMTIAAVIATVSFVDKFGKSAAFWEALFYIAGGIAVLWTVAAVINVFRYWKDARVDTLINKIKTGQS